MEKCYQVLLKVIKNIFCIQEYSDNCNKCSLCHLIDFGNLPSLKVISPDGNFIKKDQVLELRSLFSKESQYTEASIYIIKEAEKMNKESANTLLKFLEEPDGEVFGFFLTNNKDNVLPTIQSRCQLLTVPFLNNAYEQYNIDEAKYNDYLHTIDEYLNKLEIEKNKLILYNKEYLSNYERNDIITIFKIILDIYKEKLDNKYLHNEKDKYSYLNKLSTNNLKRKINLLINLLKEISYNVNIELLLDKFVIELEAVNNECL